MKKIKNLLIVLYIVVVAVMAAATIVEKYQGTEFVSAHVYGAWWFSLLWAVLTAVAIVYFLKRKVRRLSAVVLHLSFGVILLGALITHLTARQGMLHLRTGESTNEFLVSTKEGMVSERLPFSVRLNSFKIVYHEGTQAAADYESHLTISHGQQKETRTVSMNNIYSHNNIRLYQSNYDEDMQGSYLAVNSDPWGIPVTYLGYALLFIALVWMLIDPKGRYRTLLRDELGARGKKQEARGRKQEARGKKQEVRSKRQETGSKRQEAGSVARALVVLVFMSISSMCVAETKTPTAHVLPKDLAAEFGRLHVLYNNRICPLQTFAIDFTKKLYGKRSYNGLSAEQVLTGFIFYGDDWNNEPVIKMKGGPLRETLQLPKYCSVNTFFNQQMGGYIVGPYLQEYYSGQNDKFHQEVAKLDDRLQLIMQLRQGKPLKLFPYKPSSPTSKPSSPNTQHLSPITWYAPTDGLPETMEPERQQYIHEIFSLLNIDAQTQNYDRMRETVVKMQKYQKRYGGASLPSSLRVKAERISNRIPFATILFMVNLTMGFVCLFLTMLKRRQGLALAVMVLSFMALTLSLALRWIVTGHVPMSNGYETMLFLAWSVMLVTLFMQRRFPVMLTFGFLMSGFFLLVSHISQMDPQITHLMPVLNSPLLSLHVSVIMMSFALLSLTFICAVAGLLGRKGSLAQVTHHLSLIFLYPALTCLGIGIFVGAIWANVSWGTYWSWDPKEVWALITFMIYAVAVHDRSLPFLQRPVGYHIYCLLAFLTILMTYFGVNYFLGGMHSYA